MKPLSAAMLFLLVLAAPVHAAVVDTVVNDTLPGDLNLDVNGDGRTDFILENLQGESSGFLSAQFDVVSDAVTGGVTFAHAGQIIGPSTAFQGSVETGDVSCDFGSPGGGCSGLPLSEKFYVGLAFPDLSAQIHFGWAYIGLEGGFGHRPLVLSPTLFEYAYETVPDTRITIPGSAPSSVPEPLPPYAFALIGIAYVAWRGRRGRPVRG